MWLLPKARVLLGANERSGLYALGSADRLTFLGKSTGEEIGLTTPVDAPASPDAEGLVTQAAEAAGLTVSKLPRSYRIEDRASLARLHGEIKAGMFAPQTRKLLERPDFVALL
jgi:hypothetical protein